MTSDLNINFIHKNEHDTDVIIIFLHGLRGNSKKTWNLDSENNYLNFLANEDLQADIATFEYYTVALDGRSKIRNKIIQSLNCALDTNYKRKVNVPIGKIALELQTSINNRLGHYKSIILISHSMGGLIAKDLILNLMPSETHRVKLNLNLATPHRGADLAVLAKLFATNVNISELAPLSEKIAELEDRWANSQEGLPKSVFVCGNSDDVVSSNSFAPVSTPANMKEYVSEDHGSITKNENNECDTYQIIRKNVLDCGFAKDRLKRDPGKSEEFMIVGRSFNYQKFEEFGISEKQNIVLSQLPYDYKRKNSQNSEGVKYSTLIESMATQNNERISLVVYGSPGSGKSILSYSTVNYLMKSENNCPLIYIDCKSLEKDFIHSGKQEDIGSTLKNRLENSLSENQILIIDGLDELNPISQDIYQACRNAISTCHVILFYRKYKSIFDPKNDSDLLSNYKPSYRFGCSYNKGIIDSSGLGDYASFLASIFSLSESSATHAAEKMLEWFFESRNNLRLAHLVAMEYQEKRQTSATGYEFLTNFFYTYLETYREVLKPLSEEEIHSNAWGMAYDFFVNREFKIPDTPMLCVIKRITTQSFEMLGMLASEFICSEIVAISTNYSANRSFTPTKSIQHVYPYLMNKYSKHVINGNHSHQKEYFDAVACALQAEETDLRFRAFLCYLLGRFSDKNIQDKSILILVKEAEKYSGIVDVESIDETEWRLNMVLHRTIFISLIYLGHHTNEDYIALIASKNQLDSVNRGFHLAYYGDSDYIDDPDMNSFDDGREFPNTYKQMKEKITGNYNAVNSNSATPEMIELVTYTLFSIALARVGASTLSFTVKESEILELAEISLQSSNISEYTKNFIRIFKYYLLASLPPASEALRLMYQLKGNERAGWNKDGRITADAESISEHTDYCVRIAQTYLPSNSQVQALIRNGHLPQSRYEHYDKSKVIAFLISHDIGEAEHGDTIYDERAISVREKELLTVFKISVVRSCLYQPQKKENDGQVISKFLADPYDSVYKLYREFEEGSSDPRDQVNLEIARSIDCLEFLIELVMLKYNKKATIPNFHKDYSEAKSRISDRLAQEILDVVVEPIYNKMR